MRQSIFATALSLSLVFIVFAPLTGAQAGGADEDWPRWSVNDPGSSLTLDHSMWDFILQYAVVTYDAVNKGMTSSRNRPATGTRIRGTRSKISKVKKLNYVPYRVLSLSPTFKLGLNQYLGFMQDVPVSALNRTEQLAYWLNFHNAGILSAIINNYPVRKMRESLEPGGKEKGFYHEKRFTVEGYRLSLADIRDRIILANWDEPLVVYGIFSAVQGGPNLLKNAFNGQNLDRLLEKNARDFVNSKRAVKVGGRSLKYNKIYEWNAEIFGGERGILAHLMDYADGDLSSRMAAADRYGTTSFSWKLNEIRADRAAAAGLSLEGGGSTTGALGTGVWDSNWNTGTIIIDQVGR